VTENDACHLLVVFLDFLTGVKRCLAPLRTIYLYSAGSGMKNGRTRDLKDLLDIIKFLEV
jgi:hypothetical protein